MQLEQKDSNVNLHVSETEAIFSHGASREVKEPQQSCIGLS